MDQNDEDHMFVESIRSIAPHFLIVGCSRTVCIRWYQSTLILHLLISTRKLCIDHSDGGFIPYYYLFDYNSC